MVAPITTDAMRYACKRGFRVYGGKTRRPLTLYVMNTSIRKNEKKTVAPYTSARIVRAAMGTGVLKVMQNSIVENGSGDKEKRQRTPVCAARARACGAAVAPTPRWGRRGSLGSLRASRYLHPWPLRRPPPQRTAQAPGRCARLARAGKRARARRGCSERRRRRRRARSL